MLSIFFRSHSKSTICLCHHMKNMQAILCRTCGCSVQSERGNPTYIRDVLRTARFSSEFASLVFLNLESSSISHSWLVPSLTRSDTQSPTNAYRDSSDSTSALIMAPIKSSKLAGPSANQASSSQGKSTTPRKPKHRPQKDVRPLDTPALPGVQKIKASLRQTRRLLAKVHRPSISA